MNIDIATIALFLVISSIFQTIIVFFQSSLNKKYPGITTFGIGCSFFALGFLLIMLQNVLPYTLFTVVLGNVLLLLALIFQYVGLAHFLNLIEIKWLPQAIFAICLFSLIYFEFIYDSIFLRSFAIYLSFGFISFLTAFTLAKNKMTALALQTKFLSKLFLALSIFSIARGFLALFSGPMNNALSPTALQTISFTGAFIINFIVTFTFICMINKRLHTEIQDAKEQFELIFNLSPDASLITTLSDGTIINFNLGFLNFSGFSREEVLNKSLLELDIYEHLTDREKLLSELSNHQFVADFELNFRHKNQTIRICSVSAQMIKLNNVPHVISIIHDITDRKNAELALKKSEEKYRLLTEFASDVIWIFNLRKNKFTYISPAMLQLRGFSPEEAMNENLEDSMTPDSFINVQHSINTNFKSFIANPDDPHSSFIEIQQICKNGAIIWVEVSTKYRYHPSGDVEIVGVSRNIEKRKHAEEEVLYLSYHDQLTGLYNRRFYEEELGRLDTNRNFPLALIMADINGLKLINDAYGHQMGDTVLKTFAAILKAECRSDEIVSRIGGDEFVILLPKTDKDNTEKIIDRLFTAISGIKIDHSILSVSMGFSIKHDPSENMDVVFKRAEDAMYRWKLSISPSVKKATIDLIVSSIYEKNHHEMIHSKAVGDFCETIATEMKFEGDAIHQVKIAGLRHDIGEIAIDDAILNKTGTLNEAEWAEIKRHPEVGYHILCSVSELAEVAQFVLEHHERWDGQGYPKGLKEEEISLQGRIISIADAYSTMTSERPYTRALTKDEAISEIKKCSGSQFDANIAKIFIEKVLKEKW